MKLHRIFQLSILLIICVFVSSQIAVAGSIKQRMKQRLPVIAHLKAKGLIGENNRGYLGYVTSAKPKQDVIAAENRDRKTVYEYFAKQQNTSVELVEKIQAKRKAAKTKPGEFFQGPDGVWHRK
jgi:uncharacterized protein YdbL (DUF1318 family)